MSAFFPQFDWLGKRFFSSPQPAHVMYSECMDISSKMLRADSSAPSRSPRKSLDSHDSTASSQTDISGAAASRDGSQTNSRDSFEFFRHDSTHVYSYGEIITLENLSPSASTCLIRAANRDYRNACHPLFAKLKKLIGQERKANKA